MRARTATISPLEPDNTAFQHFLRHGFIII